MRLMREVRFTLTANTSTEDHAVDSWGGSPSDMLGPFLCLQVVLEGDVDARTGYLCDIKSVDRFVHREAVPRLRHRYAEPAADVPGAAAVLAELLETTAASALSPGRIEELRLMLSPYLALSARRGELPMITMTRSFEFSAAHRLYCADLSDVENDRIFGKCANPRGHGHNYVVEVSIRGQPDARTGMLFPLSRFFDIVKREVLDHLDHKHLNHDCPEFAELNPSVENIARVIWDRLTGKFGPCTLHTVRVYETPKTYAEYDGA